MSFSTFKNEMAIKNGIDVGENKSREWKDREKNYITFKDKIPGNLKLHKYGSMYFLTDEDLNYIGYIEIGEKHRKKVITGSHSSGLPDNINRGFYQVMLPLVAHYEGGTIYSDNSLSKSAIKSYTKLNKDRSFNLSLDNGKDYSQSELLSNPVTRIRIDESEIFKFCMNDFTERVTEEDMYRKMFESKDPQIVGNLFDLENLEV